MRKAYLFRTIQMRSRSQESQTTIFSKSSRSRNTLLRWKNSERSRKRSRRDGELRKQPRLEHELRLKNWLAKQRKIDYARSRRSAKGVTLTGLR